MLRAHLSKEGFTLLEVIIAMAILSVLLLGFLSAMGNGFKWIYDAGNNVSTDFTDQERLDTDLAAATGGTATTKEIIITKSGTNYRFNIGSKLFERGDLAAYSPVDASYLGH